LRLRNSEASAEVEEPLLARRVSRLPGFRKPRPESSWWLALGKSVKYVWPKAPWLRLRAIACVMLVIVTRLLNLAVPVFYGKMVDVLASVKEHSSAYYSFASIFYPWAFLFLLGRCLQGGGAHRPLRPA
jgi:hypothetical protein